MRLAGKLYVPIKGDYTFYQQGPPGTQFDLDGRALFREPAERGSFGAELDAGSHTLEVESRAVGHFNSLYWTTPGIAHYVEPIPRVYLSGPHPSWQDRLAIQITHWRWLGLVTVLLVLLFVFGRRASTE